MQQNTPGKCFEDDVIAALRRRCACEVFTSETLDLLHKVDGEIRAIGSSRLEKPVQVQITRRIDHYGKMDAYYGTRLLDTDVVSLYVEVHGGISAREAAEHVAWAAKKAQTLPPFGKLPIYGLRIDDDASFFDLQERLNELREERQSAERQVALKTGMVYRFDDNGFWIMREDVLEAYYAHYVDAFDGALRRRLRDGEMHIPVRFLPVGEARASDVRLIPPPRRARR